MQYRTISLLVFLLLFFNLFVKGQPFTKNTLEHLKVITEVYVHEHYSRSEYRRTEYFILFFQIDSLGKVSSIHMMSDDNNKDSGYVAFKKLAPSVYKEWQSEQYIGKTIILPVYCLGIEKTQSKSNSYLKYKNYPPFYKSEEYEDSKYDSQYILCQQLVYFWPSTSKSH